MVYWHVKRRSVCIYSQVTSCSASEVAAMIEGLLRHLTSAEIERQYTDTHGASVSGTGLPASQARVATVPETTDSGTGPSATAGSSVAGLSVRSE
jgi:hypothetical protein